MSFEWLSVGDILAIHEKVIRGSGGSSGILNQSAIESALVRHFTAFDSQEMFPELADKAGAFVHSSIQYHPFVDGNKRTAFLASIVIFKMNGFTIDPSDELESFFWSIARGEREPENIANYFKSRLRPYRKSPG